MGWLSLRGSERWSELRAASERARRFLEPHPRLKAGGAAARGGAGRPCFRDLASRPGHRHPAWGWREGVPTAKRAWWAPAGRIGWWWGNVCAPRVDNPQLGAALQRARPAASLPACNLAVVLGTPFPRLVKQRPRKKSGLALRSVCWARAKVGDSCNTHVFLTREEFRGGSQPWRDAPSVSKPDLAAGARGNSPHFSQAMKVSNIGF